MKLLYVALGWLALGVGVAGIFLPIVPTTPLVLLAGALWMRSSPRLHDRLLRIPRLGDLVRRSPERRTLPLRLRLLMVCSVWFSLSLCIFGLLRPWPWAQAAVAGAGLVATGCILRLGRAGHEKTDRPQGRSVHSVPGASAYALSRTLRPVRAIPDNARPR